MSKTFADYENLIKSIDAQYDKNNETIRIVLVNIVDDWKEERIKMIEAMKVAHDTMHPLNYDSINADMSRDALKVIITDSEK